MKMKLFYVLFVLIPFVGMAKSKEKQTLPNVVLIMVDDQGYGDVGAHGNKFIKTPAIDKLYKTSARFTDYHVSPTCAPTRAALLTGHHNNRTGVWHTVNGRSLILGRETTMAEVFKENGYATGIFGKWHLGDNYPFRPQDKGFEEVLINGGGGVGQTMDYWNNDYFDDHYIHNGEIKQYEGYCTDVWFQEAKKFITAQEEKPFFCYLPTNAAHSPYNVADKYYKHHEGNKDIPLPSFYGMIENADENIGNLISFLKSKGKWENTIVIFTTDNGTAKGAKVEGHRLDGFVVKGNNAGMRGIKASMYEGGHRVPFYLHWEKGGIDKGKDIDALTAHYDVFPTLMELCGLKTKIKFDGSSLVPLIREKSTKKFDDRFVVVNSQRCENPEPWRRTSFMKGPWRLVDGKELYNLDQDPEQKNDISTQYPEKIKKFSKQYDKWWREISKTYSDLPYFILGDGKENPTDLFCHDWHTDKDSPWHQRHIRTGYIDNGYWLVDIAKEGKYRFELRRWPIESGLKLRDKAPVREALPNTSTTDSKPGKALNIKKASIKIQGKEDSVLVKGTEACATFELVLAKGETKLQTWFELDNNQSIGAYYVHIERLK